MLREMKDSRISSINFIPQNWTIVQIKRLFHITAGGDAKPEFYSDFQDDEHPFPVYTNAATPNQIYAYTSKAIFEPNTITVSGRGSVGIAFHRTTPYDAIIRLLSLKPKIKIDCRYYAYSINSFMHFDNSSTAVQQLSAIQLAPHYVCVPPFDEQVCIGNYLDNKCAKIDEAISRHESIIKKLEEYKRATITKVMTKGLNPGTKMITVDSPWVKEIPSHWSYVPLKSLFRTVDVRNTDPDARLLSLYTSIGVRPRDELEGRGNKAVTVLDYKIVKKDDVIVNKLLAWMGAIAYSEYEGVTSPDYDVYRKIEGANADKYYYHNYFRYTNFKDDCYMKGHGLMLMRWRTYPYDLLRIKVPNPPADEQKEIGQYIHNICAKIDDAISRQQSAIEKLEEYKKSIIYHAVTGKIDCRNTKE